MMLRVPYSPQLHAIVLTIIMLSPSSSFLSPSNKLSYEASTKPISKNCMGMMHNIEDNVVDDALIDTEQERRLFAGFDLGTSGCRVSIIEPLPSSDGFREVYRDSVSWKDCGVSIPGNTRLEGRYDDPNSWWIAIKKLLKNCSSSSPSVSSSISSICISGTSASCLIADRTTLEVTRYPRMYDYDVLTSSSDIKDDTSGLRAIELLKKHLPSKHTARSPTGSFAKLVKWIVQSPLGRNEFLCHQSDYISTKLIFSTNGKDGEKDNKGEDIKELRSHSDWQNCLKLGYDVQNLCWPLEEWMGSCLREAIQISASKDSCNRIDDDEDPILRIIPTKVVSPGVPLGIVHDEVAKRLGLPKGVIVVGGTTDSNAAFYAAAASGPTSDNDKIRIPYGTAVTSLGSTTAIKLLSKTYVEDSSLGVYNHRFPSREIFATTNIGAVDDEAVDNEAGDDLMKNSSNEEAWLVGGASNVGCAIFRALNFTDDELQSRSKQMDPAVDSDAYLRYKYYPLLPNKAGERFPLADAAKKPVLEPIPTVDDGKTSDRTEYLKGLFQSISTDVECKGYGVLRELGASPPFPTRIMTAGGGSKNDVWTSLRQRIMNEDSNSYVEVGKAKQTEASFGAALLAAAGFRLREKKKTNQ